MGPYVQVKRDGRVATLSLKNPPYNLVVRQMTEELVGLMDQLERDSSIGAVIITSEVPGIFLSHYSVEEILQMGDALPFAPPPAVVRFFLRAESVLNYIPGFRNWMLGTMLGGVSALNLYAQMTRSIRQSSKVYIAAIQGRAMGGGCELALACDFRIMVDGKLEDGVSVIGQPGASAELHGDDDDGSLSRAEIVLGLIPGGGGTQALTRTVGKAKALELCLEGEPITAAQAAELGMITRAVKDERELRDESMKLARRMANRSPVAVRAIKRAIHTGGSLPLDEGLLIEASSFAVMSADPKCKAAMGQYLQHIDEVLGQGVTIESLRPWLEGTRIKLY